MPDYLLNKPDKVSYHHGLLLAAAIALVFSLQPLSYLLWHQDSYGFSGTRSAPDFRLYDTEGRPKTLADYRGRYLFLMFGYLRCADVCHSQVMNLMAIDNRLDDENIEYLYLALDSKHDEPSLVREYFDRRRENFTSLHAADLAQMQAVANAFHAGYRITGNPAGASYDIEHPTKIFLIDTQGRLRYTYNGLALDINRIVDDFFRLKSTPTFEKHESKQ